MRDDRGRSARPRPIGAALDRVLGPAQPLTTLAEVQRVWRTTVGPGIADVTTVAEERGGTVTIECESTVWAGELAMMEAQLLEKLRPLLGEGTPEKLRFRV